MSGQKFATTMIVGIVFVAGIHLFPVPFWTGCIIAAITGWVWGFVYDAVTSHTDHTDNHTDAG